MNKALSTVLMYFTAIQYQANRAKNSRCNLERIINKPTLTILSYVIDKTYLEKKIIGYDCGKGTFDILIFYIDYVVCKGKIYQLFSF